MSASKGTHGVGGQRDGVCGPGWGQLRGKRAAVAAMASSMGLGDGKSKREKQRLPALKGAAAVMVFGQVGRCWLPICRGRGRGGNDRALPAMRHRRRGVWDVERLSTNHHAWQEAALTHAAAAAAAAAAAGGGGEPSAKQGGAAEKDTRETASMGHASSAPEQRWHVV